MTSRQVVVFIAASSALLVFAAYMLNPLAFALSPVALAIVFFYSYTKRFTFLSHAFLGLGISGAPLGAWIAVTGRFDTPAFVLSAAVLFWLLGFDVLYALQDIDFDNRAGAPFNTSAVRHRTFALDFSDFPCNHYGDAFLAIVAAFARKVLSCWRASLTGPDRL